MAIDFAALIGGRKSGYTLPAPFYLDPEVFATTCGAPGAPGPPRRGPWHCGGAGTPRGPSRAAVGPVRDSKSPH
jgi:hypothetical protein